MELSGDLRGLFGPQQHGQKPEKARSHDPSGGEHDVGPPEAYKI